MPSKKELQTLISRGDFMGAFNAANLWLSDSPGNADALYYIAFAEYKLDDIDGARASIMSAEAAFVSVGDKRGEAKCVNLRGHCFRKEEQYPLALEQYRAALNINLANNDTEGEAIVKSNIASVYAETGRVNEALELYEEALLLNDTVGNFEGVANQHIGIGRAHEKIGLNAAAGDAYKKAIEVAATHGFSELLAKAEQYSKTISAE